jgi:hypothetical protein
LSSTFESFLFLESLSFCFCVESFDKLFGVELWVETVMNRPEPSPAVSLQVNMDLSPSLVPCFRALAFALAIYILALAYTHVAGTF